MKGISQGKRLPPRMVIYAPPGLGKSTFGGDAPKPIFLPTEDGIDALPVDRFDRKTNWLDFVADARRIATEEHDYKTIVIDTQNGLEDMLKWYSCKEHFKDNMYGLKDGFMAWGGNNGWKAAAEDMRVLLDILDQCRARGMMVIILAHVGLHPVKTPIEDFNKYAPEISKWTWGALYRWADIIGRAYYDYSVYTPKGAAKGKVTDITDSNNRQIRRIKFCGSAGDDCKCRAGYELPDVMEFSFEAVMEKLGGTGSTLEEVAALWSLLTKDEAKNTLVWLGNVKKVADAPLGKVRKLLNRLRQKQAAVTAEEQANQPSEEGANDGNAS